MELMLLEGLGVGDVGRLGDAAQVLHFRLDSERVSERLGEWKCGRVGE
jgi:hypothetical protein